MPLSEHEQRLLQEIEQALEAEDPKLASAVRSTDLRTVARRRFRWSAVAFVIGVVGLVGGVISNYLVAGIPVLGLLGFCVMFGSAVYGYSQYRRSVGTDLRVASSEGTTTSRTGGTTAARGKGASRIRGKGSLLRRMEERFHRRFDG